MPNLKFAFAMLGRPVQSAFSLKVGGVEWDAYVAALDVRDRLTHPKEAGDIKVLDDEYKKLGVTRNWFDRTFKEATVRFDAGAKRLIAARIEVDQDDGVK